MSLPSGYKKIEYIQSSGTQYIDTGFKPNQNTRLIADVEILNVPHSQLLGARIASGNASFNILVSSKTDGRDDYNETALNFAAGAARWKIDKNKNVTTVNGTAVSHPAGTFQTTCSIFINAVNTNGSPMSTTTGSARWRSVQIYDNGRLVRDFIPCKTAAGVVGLWDDVNNTFYSNAGSGTFTAGPEAIGSNRVLVDAKGYDANSGTVLVNGMVYHLKKGRGLLNGMGYDIPFDSGTPISDLAVGSTVKIAVNGTLLDFLIVHQGLPSSLYDDSCNGTWLLMKDIYENRVWQSGNINKYESSDIHAYLNSTFLNLFDSNIKDAIKQVKIPYRKNGGSGGTNQSGANGLSCKVFLLSGYEIGFTTSDNPAFPVDGAKLSYFEAGTGSSALNKRIAYLNGSAAYWWLRSPYTNVTSSVWIVHTRGYYGYGDASSLYGIRPALVLPSDTLVSDDGTITT